MFSLSKSTKDPIDKPWRAVRSVTLGQLDCFVYRNFDRGAARYCELPKCDPEDIRSTIGIILKSGLPHEFRTTCVKPIVDEDAIRTILQMITGADLFVLQRVQTRDVLHPEFFNGYDRCYDDDDLQRFQSIAASHVKSCIIR